MLKYCKSAMLAVFLVISTFPTKSFAESELILRQAADFEACHQTVSNLVKELGARPEQIRLEVDTGAVYRLKIVSFDANLVFLCNKVSEHLEILRTTPGEAVVAVR
ncbi:MAG: hypothetical protein AAF362_05205 [Pseudomonadota bacterium]